MKKNKFLIGDALFMNLPMLIETRLLIQANSGGGKSYAVRRLLEQTHGMVQQIVIDPEGEYASLRAKFDYVLAGKDGETPADPRSAKLLAERLLTLKASAILDIYELRHAARIAFVRDFLDTMVNAPKALWHPVLVVIDEAHIFCPQAKADDESSAAAAVKDICTRGRKRGFCAVLATQRLSKLHKDAAAECNNKLIGRSSMDVDMTRAAAELGFGSKDQMLSLRKLKPGDFYAFGPAISNEVTSVHVGPVISRHPKTGSKRHFHAPPPTRRIQKLLPQLADLPAEVDEHEQTMAELRASLRDAQRQANEAKRAQPTPAPVVKDVRVNVVSEKHVARIKAETQRLAKVSAAVTSQAARIDKAATSLTTALLSVTQARPAAKSILMAADKHYGVRVAEPPSPRALPPIGAASVRIPKGQRKVLIAIAQHGSDGLSREQVSIVSGFKRSTRDQYLQWLIANAMAYQDTSGRFIATLAGIAALGRDYEVLPTGDALLHHWMQRLPSGQAVVLDAVAKAYPRSLTRQDIDVATKFKRSTRDQYLQQLITRKLIVSNGDSLRASEQLFG